MIFLYATINAMLMVVVTLPKLMGWISDSHGMSADFLVPLVCLVVVAAYGLLSPRLSGIPSLVGLMTGAGH